MADQIPICGGRATQFFLLALLMAGVDCPRMRGDVVVLTAGADTEIRSSVPEQVTSGSTIVAGGLGDNALNETRRGLLRFDLTQLPAGAKIVDTQLILQVVRVPLNSADSTFEIRRLKVDWSEASATWTHRVVGIDWQTAGALGNDDSASLPSSTAFVTGLGSVVFGASPEIISDLNGWLTDPTSNHGWLLQSQSEDVLRTARHFASREAIDPETRPRLMITYAIGPVIQNVTKVGGDLAFQFEAQPNTT